MLVCSIRRGNGFLFLFAVFFCIAIRRSALASIPIVCLPTQLIREIKTVLRFDSMKIVAIKSVFFSFQINMYWFFFNVGHDHQTCLATL